MKPGPTAGRNGTEQAPHINLWIVARGINIGLNTRLYFSDEDNSRDPALNLVEQVHRRQTLIAQRHETGTGVVYKFDITLQGDAETVFFDI